MMIRKINNNKKTTVINRHLSGQVGVVGDTHFTGSHIGGDTNITSDMCTVTIIIIIIIIIIIMSLLIIHCANRRAAIYMAIK